MHMLGETWKENTAKPADDPEDHTEGEPSHHPTEAQQPSKQPSEEDAPMVSNVDELRDTPVDERHVNDFRYVVWTKPLCC